MVDTRLDNFERCVLCYHLKPEGWHPLSDADDVRVRCRRCLSVWHLSCAQKCLETWHNWSGEVSVKETYTELGFRCPLEV